MNERREIHTGRGGEKINSLLMMLSDPSSYIFNLLAYWTMGIEEGPLPKDEV